MSRESNYHREQRIKRQAIRGIQSEAAKYARCGQLDYAKLLAHDAESLAAAALSALRDFYTIALRRPAKRRSLR